MFTRREPNRRAAKTRIFIRCLRTPPGDESVFPCLLISQELEELFDFLFTLEITSNVWSGEPARLRPLDPSVSRGPPGSGASEGAGSEDEREQPWNVGGDGGKSVFP